jgi:hypothetical protein
MLSVGMFVAAILAGAETPTPPVEMVMTAGCELRARTPVGVIRVVAGSVVPPSKDKLVQSSAGPIALRGTELCPRTYYWGRCKGAVELEPRNQRWHGSLGAYSPGSGFHWRECAGVARAVVEEGQQHFGRVEEAVAWLKKKSEWMPYVYRNDGLAVGWRTVIPYRKQLTVDVWQILIGGQKPTRLPGADDGAITTSCS